MNENKILRDRRYDYYKQHYPKLSDKEINDQIIADERQDAYDKESFAEGFKKIFKKK